MIRQFRPVIGKWLFEFPAGLIEKGERPVDCARRELKEETGYTTKSIRKIAELYSSPGFTDELAHVFVAEALSKGRQHLEPMEDIKLLPMHIGKIVNAADCNRIKSAMHVAALWYVARYIRKNKKLRS